MNFIVENWYIILALAAVLGVAVWYAYRYFNLPSEAQLAKVREWLLWAVTEAEKERIILRCKDVKTKREMQKIVESLVPHMDIQEVFEEEKEHFS